MKGERIVEIGGALLFVVFILFLLPGINIGVDDLIYDISMMMAIAFFGLAVLGFILVGVGWWVKKKETGRD